MGGCHSVITPSDIPAHLQRGCSCSDAFSLFFSCCSSPSGNLPIESARFNEPKPHALEVSDDTWASLKLRVDPLAREIMDPYRVYAGAAILALLISVVFQAVRPGYDLNEITDNEEDEYYYDYVPNDDAAQGDDFWTNVSNDVEYNEWKYKNAGLKSDLGLWRVGLTMTLLLVTAVTAIVALMMERRNRQVDAQIKSICEEIRPRFEQEGYGIDYRTRTSVHGTVCGHFLPERVICFQVQSEVENGTKTNITSYSPPSGNATTERASGKTNSSYGTMNVMVPEGYKPGQVVNVMTPSGLPIMVAVPSGLQPGESFPVQIPAQMHKPQSK